MEPVESDLTEKTDETSEPAPSVDDPAVTATEPAVAHRDISEWRGRELVDCDSMGIGKLEDIYYDVETEEPQFGTVKEGLIARHLTFVPLAGITIGPDNLQVNVSREQVKSAPNIDLGSSSPIDESSLYHHYQLNYTPLATESGRRLTRR